MATDKLFEMAKDIFYKLTAAITDVFDPAVRYSDLTDKELYIRVCYLGSLSSQDYYGRLLRNIIYHDCGLMLPIKACAVRCTREQLESIVTIYKIKGIL